MRANACKFCHNNVYNNDNLPFFCGCREKREKLFTKNNLFIKMIKNLLSQSLKKWVHVVFISYVKRNRSTHN